MARSPSREFTGEVFLPGLTQLSHDVGMLRGEPVLKLIQGLDGREDGRGNFESSGFHGVDGSTIPMRYLKCDLAEIFPDQYCGQFARTRYAPTVSITFPTGQQEAATSEPMVNLFGAADDNRTVTRVTWRNSTGGSGVADGTVPWTANGIALQPGLNVITVTATDSSGNEESDALAVTYTPPVPPLPLRLTGAGHITGDAAEGAVLTVGQTYTLRAVPGAGEIFGGWSGSIVSENVQLTFTAEEGMEVVANFIANPFAAVSGAYGGLVETEPFARAMSGSADLQVTGAGSFSASLKFGAQTVGFSGAFDSRAEGKSSPSTVRCHR